MNDLSFSSLSYQLQTVFPSFQLLACRKNNYTTDYITKSISTILYSYSSFLISRITLFHSLQYQNIFRTEQTILCYYSIYVFCKGFLPMDSWKNGFLNWLNLHRFHHSSSCFWIFYIIVLFSSFNILKYIPFRMIILRCSVNLYIILYSSQYWRINTYILLTHNELANLSFNIVIWWSSIISIMTQFIPIYVFNSAYYWDDSGCCFSFHGTIQFALQSHSINSISMMIIESSIVFPSSILVYSFIALSYFSLYQE